MSLPIYQRVAVTDSGDVIPGAEYTVINENTGVAAPIYSDRTGATLLTAPYFADSAGTIQFFIAQGTTFRVAASGGVGTYTDRYVYGVSEAVFVSDNGNVEILSGNVGIGTSSPRTTLDLGMPTLSSTLSRTLTDYQMMLEAPSGGGSTYAHNIGWSEITGSDVVVAAINAIDLGAASATGITFATGTSASIAERLRIDSAGNLLVAKTSTSSSTAGIRFAGSDPGYSEHTRSGGTVMYLNRLSNDGTIMQFAQGNSAVGSIGVSGGNNISIGSTSASHAGISFATAVILPMTAGVVSNGSINLGDANSRFDSIYLASSPVVTSDRNQKQDILEITTAETAVATVCKGLMRSFRLKDAVAKKGDDARIHFGIMAQDLQDAFTAEGLDAGRYGMFISTTWWETQAEVAAVEAVEAVTDEDGNVTTEAVEAKDAYTRTDTFDTLAEAPAGATERTRLGVRYSELLAFIIAAL